MTCMIPIPTIPTMPSAHGMTSAVPSAPTILPMPTIQTTPSAPTCTCSVSSQCTRHSSLL